MVCIIVNAWAYRVRNNGILESSSVKIRGQGVISHLEIQNDWAERLPELTDVSGADQSIIYGTLLQLSATLPKLGERQPHREWTAPVLSNNETPMA